VEAAKPSPLDDYLFDLRGYLILRNVIAPDLVDELNGEFDKFPRDLKLADWYKGAQRRDYDPATGMELHHCLEIGGPFEALIDNPGWINHVRHYAGEEDSYVRGVFIDECIEAVRRLMESSFQGPVNIGSEEMVTINQMAEMIMKIADKKLSIKHIPGPTGVRGRNSDNKLLRKELGWEPRRSLFEGLSKTYPWIHGQMQASSKESPKVAAGTR